jgi:hypothetical protein
MIALLVFVSVAVAADPAQKEKPLTEDQKIEALIKHVAELKDAQFVRNDKEHDAKAAAEHLRKKWDYAKKEIKTARDFVDKIASKSSTTGKPYLIRFKNGREVKAGEYLLERLKEIEAGKKNPP